MVLEKNPTLFSRDEKGELIPQEVPLVIDEDDEEQVEYKDETIFVIPMARGEVRKMLSDLTISGKEDDKDIDAELIEKYCKKPSYTKEEVQHMKPQFSSMIVNTILRESGISARGSSKKKAIEAKEDEFGKNSVGLSQSKKKQI